MYFTPSCTYIWVYVNWTWLLSLNHYFIGPYPYSRYYSVCMLCCFYQKLDRETDWGYLNHLEETLWLEVFFQIKNVTSWFLLKLCKIPLFHTSNNLETHPLYYFFNIIVLFVSKFSVKGVLSGNSDIGNLNNHWILNLDIVWSYRKNGHSVVMLTPERERL